MTASPGTPPPPPLRTDMALRGVPIFIAAGRRSMTTLLAD